VATVVVVGLYSTVDPQSSYESHRKAFVCAFASLSAVGVQTISGGGLGLTTFNGRRRFVFIAVWVVTWSPSAIAVAVSHPFHLLIEPSR
jgi:hypothetical protein